MMKFKTEDQKLEAEILEVRENLRKKIRKIEEPNHAEFIGFMLTNYNYKHDYMRIDRDLTLKLKEEE